MTERPIETDGRKESAPSNSETHDRQAQAVDHEEAPRLPFPVVGIGASAGGLEAAIEFFQATPPDIGVAFVFIQHLPPDRESLIADILGKRTKMKVLQVEEGMTVEPNTVYVIRPGHTLTIKRGVLHLGAPLAAPGHNRPVDDFFRSLADEQRERAIGVILSGMGSNGTSGAEVIKAVGGMLIAQDPDAAKFPSMPRHLIDAGLADFILQPAEMPEVLVKYIRHPYASGDVARSISLPRVHEHFGEILAVLKSRTRLDFNGYKKPTILRRIQRRMGLHQIEELGDYSSVVRQNPTEAAALADDLMIHVSGFFRDPEAWDALRRLVIEPLVAERDVDSSIRCWVTACSSGEEAYTMAMALTEACEAAERTFDVKVFATDTADRSLAMARTGMYPLGIEAEVSPERLERFFDREDSVYRVKREIREMVVFAPQNVIQDPPFSRLDIAACRNLLIYLEPELQRRVLSLLHFGLREGGALFLGASETTTGSEELFEPIDKKHRIFRRVGPTRHGLVEFPYRSSTPSLQDEQRGIPRAILKASLPQIAQRMLLEHYTPAAVLVDRQFRIVFFHGDTSEVLSQPSGEPTRELLALAREGIRGAIRAALQQAQETGEPASIRDGSIETREGRFRLFITATPIDPRLAAGFFLVSFEKREEPAPVAPIEPHGVESHELRVELSRMAEELQSTIEELQTSNEELCASNEEAMSVNEELQSANEELETSHEELQSLNEELTTVNSQLQLKMEELEATTSDLTSLLASTDIAVVFLNTRFEIRRYTPATRELMDLIPGDVGRPLSDMATKFHDPKLLADCRTVLDRLIPMEAEVTSTANRAYLRRILPYRTTDSRITGVVITFVDITARKEAEAALRASEERLRLIFDGAQDFAMILFNTEGKIESWNVGAERVLGFSAKEAVGKSGSLFLPGPDAATKWKHELTTARESGRCIEDGWHVRKNGETFWGSGVLTAVSDPDGALTGFVKILRDETLRRRVLGATDGRAASQ
jgi:two-component system, chemotaxis family, CheB/CheR fusion protein